jgi:hypothetical protein
MKRLTERFKKWLRHRQRYATRHHKAAKARLSRAILTRKMTVLYGEVQRLVRKLGRVDSFYAIWAYSQYLQTPDFKIPGDIEVAPQFLEAPLAQAMLAEWTLEQIAREVIQHAGDEPKEGRSLRQWGTLAQIANTLRDLEGEIYARLVGAKKIHLELMRISHRQFVWQQQRPKYNGIIRYYKLFNVPEINPLLRQVTGLTVDQIYLIGMSLFGHFFESPFVYQPIKVTIPGISQQDINCFLRFMSLDYFDLRKRLNAEHKLDADFAYRYSSLREYPLIGISHQGQTSFACPIPTLLFWRLTSGLYYLLKHEKGFSNPFGRSFQNYIGQVSARRITTDALQLLEETEYQVGKERKDTVDWVINQGGDAAIFLECKTKRLTWDAKVNLADLTALDHDIRKLSGAIVQVYRTIKDYRDGHYPHLPFLVERRIYPIVVTLEDWYLFGQELPGRLDAYVRNDMLKAGLPTDWVQQMPYSIMSIDEFETAIGVVNTVGVHTFVSGKVLDPERRRWAYGAYCLDRYKKEVGDLPSVFDDEFEAMFSALKDLGEERDVSSG